MSTLSKARLIDIELDETVGHTTAQTEHEHSVAIADLLEQNSFQPLDDNKGPYKLKLSVIDKKLIFDISREDDSSVGIHILSLIPFRLVIRDYYLICDSYYEATRSATPSKIEAIDMERRSLHNEGSQTLIDHLSGKIGMDFDTARRLFTLLCVLHWKGDHG